MFFNKVFVQNCCLVLNKIFQGFKDKYFAVSVRINAFSIKSTVR